METTQIKNHVNSICEHNWHKHEFRHSINAQTLLEEVREKLYDSKAPHLKSYVDDWIAEFSTRTGYYRCSNTGKVIESGGRVSEN